MASPTMKFSPLVVRCIRNTKKPETDEKIVIKPLNMECCGYSEEKLFSMEYTTEISTPTKNKMELNRSTMNVETLHVYIGTLLEMLYLDEEPFEGIQFDLPGIPTILVCAKTLSRVRPYLENYLTKLMATNMDAWPRIVNSSNQCTKSHLFFDEDGKTVEEHYWRNYSA